MTGAMAAVVLAAAAGWLFAGAGLSRRRVVGLSVGTPATGWRRRGEDVLQGCWRRVRRGHLASAARRNVTELCVAMAAELGAGRAPPQALRLAVAALAPNDRRPFAEVVATAEGGGDVPRAMIRVAELPGYRSMAWLAACWQVGAASGAGLGEALDRLARSLRDDEQRRREVSAQLAAPRATARLLACLPLLGIVMATGFGGRPASFLFGTPYGLGCLVLGVGLNILGLMWTSRLARSVETR